jgi:hypothetical protein
MIKNKHYQIKFLKRKKTHTKATNKHFCQYRINSLEKSCKFIFSHFYLNMKSPCGIYNFNIEKKKKLIFFSFLEELIEFQVFPNKKENFENLKNKIYIHF